MFFLTAKRSPQSITLLSLIIVLLFAPSASAQIYKWTDAQGKVHYSDKKIADTAQAQDINLGTMPAAKAVESLTANRYQNERPSLYLLRHELAMDKLNLSSSANFAYFYFGGDCVSPTAVSYGEYVKRYKHSLPKSDDIFLYEGRVFNQYRIRTENATYAIDNPRSVIDADGNQPLKLQVEVVNMRVNACLKNTQKSTVSGNLDKISGYGFDKANVWLQLRATITTASDDIVLLNTLTEGAANDIAGHSGNIARLAIAAYEQAITNLIANPTFIELLTPKSKVQAINISENKPAAPQESEGLLNRLANKLQFNSVTKSRLAEVLSLVNPTRFSITQYYADVGKWPNSFSDINLSSSDFTQKDLIDAAELRLGGVLHLRLARSTFGENEVVQLIPKPIMNGQSIDWECRTSLDKSLWVGDCQGM
jgi:hypothetical protein